MAETFVERLAEAAGAARRSAGAFPGAVSGDQLPWRVVEAYDADVRGLLERDPRIEDERDRVLIAAVRLAESPAEDAPAQRDAARRDLLRAIDYLHEAVLRFGLLNRQAARLGFGAPGEAVRGPA